MENKVTKKKDKKKNSQEEKKKEVMPVKKRPKKSSKTKSRKATQKAKKKTKAKEKEPSKTKEEKTKKAIPKEWKKDDDSEKEEKKKRTGLIAALKRSIFTKDEPQITEEETIEPMNIVVTLNPAKHRDIIEYFEENILYGGRAEWVRDSIRLKMRVEEGIYGLEKPGQEGSTKDTEKMMQDVFGQFAQVMTDVMSNIRANQTQAVGSGAPRRQLISRPSSQSDLGNAPKLKKMNGGEKSQDFKPDRPALDDAIGSIVVVE
jgi:hypothetical protein